MFETPAISRQQIALKITPGLHVRFWSCNLFATKIASSCRNQNRLRKRAFERRVCKHACDDTLVRFQCGVMLVIREAWKVSILAIVILWSSWPPNTLVRFQCGSADDKWGFKRSRKSKSLPMPIARLCPPHYAKRCVAFFIHSYGSYNMNGLYYITQKRTPTAQGH